MKNFILVGLFLIAFISNINAQIYKSEFSNGCAGWSGDFADYPASDSVIYQLELTRTTLPEYFDAGIYALKISGNDHSDKTLNFLVAADVTDENSAEKINIYPNPATNNLTINISPIFLGSTYLITDLSGRTVINGVFYSEISNIKVDYLPAGMYLLKIWKQNSNKDRFFENFAIRLQRNKNEKLVRL